MDDMFCSANIWKIIQKLMHITLSQLLKILLTVAVFILIWCYRDSSTNSEPTDLIVWWTLSFPGTSEVRHCSSDLQCQVLSTQNPDAEKVGAYLFYGSNISFDKLPLPRYPNNILWGLFHEESPRNVEELMHTEILSLFNFSSTFSRHSDVPFPLQYLNSLHDITSNEFYIDTSQKSLYLKDIAPVLYLQTDCETSTQRDIYVKELMKYINIDSYGRCLNNKQLPNKFKDDYLNNLDESEFLHFVAKYKFVIAIENGVCTDYVTEKLWRAIKVGSVPIYFGSPKIEDWLPNKKSALLLKDFPTPKAMSEQIYKLLKNDHLYEQYLEHKTQQIISNHKLLNEIKARDYQFDALKTVEKFECFICQKLSDKRKGKLHTHIIDKSHYDCPKPLSALTLSVNVTSSWVYSWDTSKRNIKKLLKTII